MITAPILTMTAQVANACTSGARARRAAFAALAAGALVATPAVSHAQADDAMDACIKAFVAMNLPKEQPVRVMKELASPSAFDYLGRVHRISLTATGARSGKKLARGECIVDRAGVVIALNGKRLPAHLAAIPPRATEATAAR